MFKEEHTLTHTHNYKCQKHSPSPASTPEVHIQQKTVFMCTHTHKHAQTQKPWLKNEAVSHIMSTTCQRESR